MTTSKTPIERGDAGDGVEPADFNAEARPGLHPGITIPGSKETADKNGQSFFHRAFLPG